MRCISTFIWVLITTAVVGQSSLLDTIVSVDSIIISTRVFQEGQFLDVGSDVGRMIQKSTTTNIRSYGPGQLTTWSARGSSAGQNSIYWNGLEISSPMLGQIDLSQLRHGTHNRAHISSFGLGNQSTAIGGQINLSTTWEDTLQQELSAQMRLGSFESYDGSIAWKSRQHYYRSSSSMHYGRSKNNFSFVNGIGERARMTHSEKMEWNLAHSSQWSVSSTDKLEAHVWLRGQDLNIGPAIHQSRSQATQADQNYRVALNWASQIRSWDCNVRAGFLHDRIQYMDPLIGVHDPAQNSVYLFNLSFSNYYKSYHVNFGYDIKYSRAKSANYNFRPSQSLQKAFIHIRRTWSSKLKTDVLINQLHLDNELLVPAFRLSQTYNFLNNYSLVGRIARAIRIPTLNDLYWTQGGNPDLNPEVAWKGELGLRNLKIIGPLRVESDFKIFSTYTVDWILWQPVSGNLWSPINIREVWSRGINPSIQMIWQPELSHVFSATLAYEWVNATYQNALAAQDVSLGKQLIYIPQHKMLFDISYSHQRWAIDATIHHTSRTYTSRDNLRWLPSYSLVDLSMIRQLEFSNIAVELEIGVNNMLNSSYQVVEARAMPLRNYYIKLKINPFKNDSKI